MIRRKLLKWAFLTIVALTFRIEGAAACKALVVVSYAEDFFWSQEIKQGVDEALQDHCELRYVYWDTLGKPGTQASLAQETLKIYQEWQPDGVIAEGDDTQVFFVIPYLRNKVATPVMIAETFGDPTKYAGQNVSGVPGNPRFRESMNFLRQLAPSVKSLFIIAQDNEVAQAGAPLIRKIALELGLTAPQPFLSNDHAAILAKVEEIEPTYDALYTVPSLGKELVGQMVRNFGKPTVTSWREGVNFGILCGVNESGAEVGKLAGTMLDKAMKGTPVKDIPFASPEFGTRILNVDTLKALGIQPSRRVLAGVELIKTE